MRTIADFAPPWENPDSASRSSGGDGVLRGTKRQRRDSLDEEHEDASSYTSSLSVPAPFVKPRRARASPGTISEGLASLNPPLYPHPPPPSHTGTASSLQHQHLAVMTSILHLSLQRGDYARAGQVFSTLLRAGSGVVNSLSLRSSGNWGIGAEILLRRSPDHLANLAAARDYYEALILQYPFRKTAPHAVDARTFYPPLFGVMIYEATLAAHVQLQHQPGRSPPPPPPSSEEDAEVRAAELRAARAIALRMEDLLASPPYDRFAPLLRLRGMVGLWMADLVSADEDGDEDELRERERARVWFERCRAAGGDVPDDVDGAD